MSALFFGTHPGTLSVGRKEFTNIPLDAKPSSVYNNSRL